MVTATGAGSVLATGFAADPRLPHRDRLLDEIAMTQLLTGALGLDGSSCHRLRTKYRVGDSLRVSYEIRPRSGERQRVSLRCFSDGRMNVGASTPDVNFAEVAALGWVFPNDRKLAALATFWNEAPTRHAVFGLATDRLDLAAYAPEKAATIRCWAGGRVLGFAKLYAGGEHRASIDVHRTIGLMLAELGIGAPEVLATDDGLGLLVLSPVEGATIASRHQAVDWYRLGQAAAHFHSLPRPERLPKFERATMPRLRTAARFIVAARPDVAPLVERLLDALDRAQAKFEQGPDVLLHGDLHGKNVLCTDQGLSFIDLDQASVGPAAAELGSALAALRYDAPALSPPVTPFETHFLQGYGAVGLLPLPEALAWHIGAALLGERALRAVNRVRLDGLARLPTILEMALDTVDGADR